uniref:Uncharacterized protein n=1 Tax=Panagrolaimus davidi TaxID=227884 RepID=A0A914P7H3_9BILA
MSKITALPRKKKLSKFNLTFIDGPIDYALYINFIKKHFTANADFDLTFSPSQMDVKETLKNAINEWDSQNQKPNFRGSLPENIEFLDDYYYDFEDSDDNYSDSDEEK